MTIQEMTEHAKMVSELLRILSNEHRLLILCSLMEGPHTVTEIHTYTPDISRSALSQHLQQLKISGILDSRKHGMNVVYQIRDERVTALMSAIKTYYCE